MSQRDQYTKTIATLHVLAIELEAYDTTESPFGTSRTDDQPAAVHGCPKCGFLSRPAIDVDITHCDKSPLKLRLRTGDSVVFDYAPEIDAPDGKSLVRAAWAVLLDILGFKKVEPR